MEKKERKPYPKGVTRNKETKTSKCYSIRFELDLEEVVKNQPNRNKFINELVRAYVEGRIVTLERAKEAHRDTCQMVNCVDCLFGLCREDCEYQKEFEHKILGK